MATETAVRERPILFSGPMVRAILDGRKTQTRRVIKPQPEFFTSDIEGGIEFECPTTSGTYSKKSFARLCPYGKPGERLWVREAFYDRADYAAIGKHHKERFVYVVDGVKGGWRAHPSIHMPRIASRITLEITDVRVERLQEISEEDAVAEGLRKTSFRDGRGEESARWNFRTLWDSINGKKYPWASNPWAWAITFRKV